jgi:hypothetical protein
MCDVSGMNLSFRMTWWSAWLCLLAGALTAQTPGISLTLNPNPVQVGQMSALVLTLENLAVGGTPELQLPPQIQVVGGVQRQNQFEISNGVRSVRETIVYPVAATEEGEFKIEPQALDAAGQLVTPELIVKVVPAGQMPAADEDAIDPLAPLLQLQMGKTEFFVGELVPITAMLFIPRRTQLERQGLVDIQKDGFAIQRFPQGAEQSMQTIGGMPYTTYTYRSTLSALKAGKLKVGPASMEIIYHVPLGGRQQQGLGIFGMMQMESKRVVVPAPEVMVEVLPLPAEGKPANFSGAVGQFTLNATAGVVEAQVGDPVPVDLSIQGQGNFDSIQAPTLTATKGWKVFPPRRYTVGDENANNRDLMNQRIGFSVVLIPQELHTEVPSFEFAYFNPESRKYVTLRSDSLPITIRPGQSAPTAAAATSGAVAGGPVVAPRPPPLQATLADIVTTLPPRATWAVALPQVLQDRRFIVVNGLLAAAFVGLIGWLVFQRLRARPVNLEAVKRAELIAAASESGLSRKEFYRRVAQVLQGTGLSAGVAAEVDQLWQNYEMENFSVDQKETPLDPSERAAVLDLLKNGSRNETVTSLRTHLSKSMAVIAIVASLSSGAASADLSADERFEAAVSALEKKNYTAVRQVVEGLAKEGKISRELFELAGHATYREGQFGLAAMWYQRAQLFPRPSVELRQNLRHVAQRIQVLSPPRDEMLLHFAQWLSRNEWALLASMGGWLSVFCVVFLVTGARGTLAIAVAATLVLGVVALGSGVAGLIQRPTYDDVKDLAFVVTPKSQLHASATVVAGQVISTPEGSVVKVVDQRGTWTYAEVKVGENEEVLRGWIPSASLSPVWPYDPSLLP